MVGFSVPGRMRGDQTSMQMLASLRKFTADEVAQELWKIIQFYAEHGEAETQKYLGANRKTIHVWKKRLAASGQHLVALVARSTRPQRVRRMTTDPQVLSFIQQPREEHPRGEGEDQALVGLALPEVGDPLAGGLDHRQDHQTAPAILPEKRAGLP